MTIPICVNLKFNSFTARLRPIIVLMRDVRYSFRILRRDPGFATVAILALALGIGANTAIFSVVNAALLRPLPYPDGARLMVVWDRLSKLGIAEFPVSYANYLDYKAENRVF